MEREQIKKALECCTSEINKCADCPRYRFVPCTKSLLTDALSLINELTEENERLNASCTELTRKMQDSVRAENEALRKSQECDLRKFRADTVRKMQERFIAEIEQTPNANEHFIKAWKSKIDQIAKEMLEGL